MTPQEKDILVQSVCAAITYADTVEVTVITCRTRVDKDGNLLQVKDVLEVLLPTREGREYLRTVLRNGSIPVSYRREA